MVKGKPWNIKEEQRLRQLIEEGKSVDVICKIMIKTRDAVAQKMFDLKLKAVKEKKLLFLEKKLFFLLLNLTFQMTCQTLMKPFRSWAQHYSREQRLD